MQLAKLFLTLAAGTIFAFSPKWAAAQTNFWQQTNGPLGATINAVAINQTDGNVFTAVQNVGMIRSTNKGASWSVVNTGLTSLDIRALLINTNGHVFAGTAQGVFRSTDNGATWAPSNIGLPNVKSIYSLSANSSGHIFAGLSSSGSGVFRTTDNGGNWSKVFAANIGVQTLAINSRGDILAGTSGSGIQRSIDNGNSWTAVNNGLYDFMINALAINQSANEIFAGLNCGVFRSIDSGNNWTSVNAGLIYTQIMTWFMRLPLIRAGGSMPERASSNCAVLVFATTAIFFVRQTTAGVGRRSPRN